MDLGTSEDAHKGMAHLLPLEVSVPCGIGDRRTVRYLMEAHCEELTAAVGGRDLGLRRGEGWHVEKLRDALPALDLHEQNSASAGSQ